MTFCYPFYETVFFSDLWQSHGKRMDAAVKLRSFEASYKQLVASLLSHDLKIYLQLLHFALTGLTRKCSKYILKIL